VYTLHITNKNYSSWSLRPWVLMRACGIEFDEVLHRFTPRQSERLPRHFALRPGTLAGGWRHRGLGFAGHRRIPCPSGIRRSGRPTTRARAWARCAAAEMHSGFATLRNEHGMNIGVRVAVTNRSPGLLADIARIERLWSEGVDRFGGPFLAGPEFSSVDAFFAPVVYRFRSYGVAVADTTADYMDAMLGHPALREWELAALDEDFRDPAHEAELAQIGTVTDDLRVAAT
jgi:glutathione S-transferase